MLVRPPLPFIGNKSKYRGTILQILQSYIPIVSKQQDFYIVDVFGGSRFCAYLARQVFPDETHIHVIYNDYDNYVNRLLKIDQTNRILQQCRVVSSSCGIQNDADGLYSVAFSRSAKAF